MDSKDPIWREAVSRIAMVVLAVVLLAGAIGLIYGAWVLWEADQSVARPGRRGGGFSVAVMMALLGAGLAWSGLFLIKRAFLPADADESLPDPPVTGDRSGSFDDSGRWSDLF